MEIILLKDVENIGRAGEVARVRDGYFRNYLLPQKLAVLASTGGLRFLEAKKKQGILRDTREKEKALKIAEQLKEMQLVIPARVGQEGKLFGSVTNQDIEKALQAKDVFVTRKHIELVPIHQAGEYTTHIRLHTEVSVNMKVIVQAAA